MTHTDVTDTLNEARFFAERRARQRVVLMIVPALLGILVTLWSIGIGDEFFYRKSLIPKELYLTMGLTLVGFSGLAAVMTYLQTGFKRATEIEVDTLKFQRELESTKADRDAEISAVTKQLQQDLASARAEFTQAKNSWLGIDPDEREAIVSSLKSEIEAESKGRLLEELRQSVANSHLRDTRERELLDRLDASRNRLMLELESLGRRGNLNLALGAVTTVVGLALLGLSVYSELSASKDMWTFVSHFVPRLTLVLMIELFAYFFLSLYKTSLGEIKYFQNELTNIESKQIALRAALTGTDQAVVAGILTKLADTDRNHILSKDQTTVELEKARIERDGRGEIAKYLSELFAKKA